MDPRSRERPVTLVWIDARVARIVRWMDGGATIDRVESDVPAHRGSAGHVRHDPTIRSGGGGSATAGEPRRLEHLARFLDAVAHRLPEGDLELIGPGTTHERLAGVLRGTDPHGSRRIHVTASPPRTDRQLIAALRRLSGHEPRRRTSIGTRRLA